MSQAVLNQPSEETLERAPSKLSPEDQACERTVLFLLEQPHFLYHKLGRVAAAELWKEPEVGLGEEKHDAERRHVARQLFQITHVAELVSSAQAKGKKTMDTIAINPEAIVDLHKTPVEGQSNFITQKVLDRTRELVRIG